MVVALVAVVVVGMPRELAPADREVVAARALGDDAERLERAHEHVGLRVEVPLVGGEDEREIEVAEVVVDGPAAREAPCELPAVGF